ncbi:hypothetical protein WI460_05000 [Gemmatimonadota bacterium Y43]|uniref:hypothetical protein n=1 Tax=Gaopeijia maritima TaxID=3119007 RepID=UPI00326D2106
MISYVTYKIIHYLGIFTAVTAVAAYAVLATGGSPLQRDAWTKKLAAAHGIGLFLVLLGGFGMLARLGVSHGGLPTWIWIKLAIWVLLGGVLTLAKRRPETAGWVLFIAPFLAAAAGTVALLKPGL